MNIMVRIKSYAFWLSAASFVLLVLQNFGINIDLGQYEDIVNSVLSILVFLGIINNPTTNNKGFLDD